MNYFWGYAILIIFIVFVLPLLCYLCTKMGTLGYLRAKMRFDQLMENGEKKNG